jgi:hypothetical protein
MQLDNERNVNGFKREAFLTGQVRLCGEPSGYVKLWTNWFDPMHVSPTNRSGQRQAG